MPRARSRTSARAVRKTIGMSLVTGSSRSISATRQPSSPGIITSRRMTSGCWARARSSPPGPSPASLTRIPSASRLTRQRSRIGASSSMTSTRVTTRRLQRRALGARRRSSGSSKVKREPSPSSESTQIRPPMAVTRPRTRKRPEARFPGPAGRPLGAEELREDALLVGLGIPIPSSGDRDLGGPRAAPDADRDRPAFGRVPDRVVQEVGEHLRQFLPVGSDDEVGRLDLEREPVEPFVPLRAVDTASRWRAEVGRLERRPPGRRPRAGRRSAGRRRCRMRRSDSRRDVAEEGLALGIGEVDVAALEVSAKP